VDRQWNSPYINRFLSADTIVPGYANPQSLNRYSYVNNNPLRYTDPTGHMQCEEEQGSCSSENQVTKSYKNKLEKSRVANKIHKKFNNATVKDPSAWQLHDLNEIYYGLSQIDNIRGFDGNTGAINTAFGNVTFVSGYFPGKKVGDADWSSGVIRLEPAATGDTVVHEMGHIFDGGLKRLNNDVPLYSNAYANVFDAGPGSTDYAQSEKSSSEDFADSFLAVIKYGKSNNPAISENRVTLITALIQNYTYLGR